MARRISEGTDSLGEPVDTGLTPLCWHNLTADRLIVKEGEKAVVLTYLWF
jgi:hypothetical protein